MTQSSQSRRRTGFVAAAAGVFWFALALQLALSVQLTLARGGTVLQALWTYVAFFTVLTNLLAALALSAPLIAPRRSWSALFGRPATITAVAAYMALVGITYNLLLRNVWQPQGWQLVADVLLHAVNPVLFALYWWWCGRSPSVGYKAIVAWTAYPLAYFIYATARGLAGGFYAYPFIDVATLGFGRVLVNAVAIACGFALLAALFIALGRRARRDRA